MTIRLHLQNRTNGQILWEDPILSRCEYPLAGLDFNLIADVFESQQRFARAPHRPLSPRLSQQRAHAAFLVGKQEHL